MYSICVLFFKKMIYSFNKCLLSTSPATGTIRSRHIDQSLPFYKIVQGSIDLIHYGSIFN